MNETTQKLQQRAQAAEAAGRQAGVEAGVAAARAEAERRMGEYMGGNGTEAPSRGSSNELVRQLIQAGSMQRGAR